MPFTVAIRADALPASAPSTASFTWLSHSNCAPSASARAASSECRCGRRTPMPSPSGKRASTLCIALAKRTPRKLCPSAPESVTPSCARTARESGIRPSPQALSMAGGRASTTAQAMPRWRSAMAAARPAGPPPTMSASVSRGARWAVLQFAVASVARVGKSVASLSVRGCLRFRRAVPGGQDRARRTRRQRRYAARPPRW